VARTYITFGDLEGKLEVLRVEYSRCQRNGRHSVAKLIEKYGRQANMMKWREQLNGDCPKRLPASGRSTEQCRASTGGDRATAQKCAAVPCCIRSILEVDRRPRAVLTAKTKRPPFGSPPF